MSLNTVVCAADKSTQLDSKFKLILKVYFPCRRYAAHVYVDYFLRLMSRATF